ncbi:unnamed protein product, partial [Closterium sp. NIES-65]
VNEEQGECAASKGEEATTHGGAKGGMRGEGEGERAAGRKDCGSTAGERSAKGCSYCSSGGNQWSRYKQIQYEHAQYKHHQHRHFY